MQEDMNNMTAYAMAQQMAESVAPMEITGEVEQNLRSGIKTVVMDSLKGTYFALMSPNFKYLTMFKKGDETGTAVFTEGILEFLKDEADNLGGFKGMEPIREQGALEMWFGNSLFMLFNYDHAVEEI